MAGAPLCARAVALTALLALALAPSSLALIKTPRALGDWMNGSSLFWGGPQDGQDDPFNMRLPAGACGYGEMDSKMWPFYYVAAVSPNSPLVESRPQAACGTCLEVECQDPDNTACSSARSITVQVTDECPQCAANQINLHAFAFERIGRLKLGSAPIRYRQVECSPVDNITVRVDGFRVSQGGWLRIALKSVAGDGGVTRVELARSMDGAVGSNSTHTSTADAPSMLTVNANASSAKPAPAKPGAAATATPAAAAAAATPAAAAAVPAAAANADPTAAVMPDAAATAADNATLAKQQNWRLMDNTYGAEWEMSALPAPPYDLRITDVFGRQVLLTRVITRAGALGEMPSQGQFAALDNATIAVYEKVMAESEAAPVKSAAAAKQVAAATPAAKPATVPAVEAAKAQRRRLLQKTKVVSARKLRQEEQAATGGQAKSRGNRAGPMP
ncbi:hypothetical protein HYH03_014586 [Edaphochlamys debaryana]|uniref:Expansin-like EG45 domain-containing protein n=1 Tax=Edaphochlamys debaryana TaxID=47281 RepID=A0A835XNU3_9CHLO|nr:hypothetical protein HYH03_014586 [Edaphochlamys debaryana]|eukprot:KAG2486787.1 hypothetical protein HYH03_014586 [Edaphochlamys debaryana]